MDQFINPANVIGLFAVAAFVVRGLADLRTLRFVQPGKEAITRAEYERDETSRKEQIRTLEVKCRNNARRQTAHRRDTDAKFDKMLDGLNDLRVQLARVATCLEQEQGARPPHPEESH